MPPNEGADLLRIEDQLTEEERLVRDTVRDFAAERAAPYVADWFEAGTLPRELAPELGKLGMLGMHLTGYGCAGLGSVAYGVACRELEACDSGLRSLVSVQGSLAMYPIWRYGSEEQKQEWLPRMAAGDAVGCFGLTEPDQGSDPGSMKTKAVQNGSGWTLSGTKMWITNGSVADIAVVWAATEQGIRGFLVPRGARGFTASNIHKKLSLRASVTSELHFDEVKLPGDAVLPGVTGLKGPLSCLSEARFGIVWGVTGAARTCFQTAAEYSRTREQFGQPIGGFQLTQSKLAWMLADLSRASCWPCTSAGEGGWHHNADAGQPGQDGQRPGGDRDRQAGADHPRRERRDAGVPGDQARRQPGVRTHLRGHRGNPRARPRPGDHRPVRLSLTRPAFCRKGVRFLRGVSSGRRSPGR